VGAGSTWDQLGARKFVWDARNFRCARRRPGGAGSSSDMCLEPLLLSPEIEKVRASCLIAKALVRHDPKRVLSSPARRHSG
jgi:hypothetical protein